MSAYTDALRSLAEILDANPKWVGMASFGADIRGDAYHPHLHVHPRSLAAARTIATGLNGEGWEPGSIPGNRDAHNACGFYRITIYEPYA